MSFSSRSSFDSERFALLERQLELEAPDHDDMPAIRRRPRNGSAPRSRSKSPTTACTSTRGYSAAIPFALARDVCSLTSNGTKRSSDPAFSSASRLQQGFGSLARVLEDLGELSK
jgi:hypothetical protein